MATKKLGSVVQINDEDYGIIAEKVVNSLTIKNGDADPVYFDGSEAKNITIAKETTLTIVNKTQTDTDDTVYAVTNLAEDPNTQNGHHVTPTYTAVPTKKYVDDKVASVQGGGGSGGTSDVATKIKVTMQDNSTKDATITIKSDDPSGGNVGDIWFKY